MKKKLLLTIGLWVFVIGAAIGSMNYFETRRQLQALMDSQLQDAARILLEQALHEMREHSYEEPDLVLQEELYDDRNLPNVEFQIFNGEGQLFLRSSKLLPLHPLTHLPTGFDTRELASEPWRIFVLWSADKRLQVQVAQKISFRQKLSRDFLLTIMMPLFFLLPLLLIFISITIARSFKPLEHFAIEVKNRGPNDLAPISGSETYLQSELQPIVKEMNALLERLHHALDSEKRLTASAAHELRTPLAQLKVQTQLAMAAESPEVRQASLEKANDVINKLSRRVSQLLSLARLDHEVVALPRKAMDVQKVVKEEIAALVPMCLEKNIEISANTEFFVIDGYEDLLAVLFRNLLENAIKYTDHGGAIQVSLKKKSPGEAEFRLIDSGPGMNAEDLEKLLEMNYRLHIGSKEGTGIGLSLVKKIADLHKFGLKVGNRTDGSSGLLVVVELKAYTR